jgi:chromosome partitioning protein
MSKIISIVNHKGGVGKTSSALSIGAGLASLGKKILLVDIDAQANLSQSLGINAGDNNIYRAMIGEIDLPIYEVKANLDIVPSHLDLSVAEIALAGEAGREFILKEILEKHIDKYDYILIDCPPSLGLLTVNALVASNSIIIPLETQYLAIQGMKTLLDVIDKVKSRLNKKLSDYKILLTKYDSRRSLDRSVCDNVRNVYRENVFGTVIRNNVAIAEAPIEKKDIFDYAPSSNGAEDYLGVCSEILKD